MIDTFLLMIGSILAVGLGFLGYKYHKRIDFDKIDTIDIKDLYDMTVEFVKGGDDNKIDAGDAIILLTRLEALLSDNVKDEIEEEIELFDEELEEIQKIEDELQTENPTK